MSNCLTCGKRFNPTFRRGSSFCTEDCEEVELTPTIPPRIKKLIEEHNIDLSKPVPCIYFIQCGDSGPIKIGVTVNLPARLRDLQASNPYELKVLTAIEKGSQKREWEIHGMFQHLRIRNEWFQPAQELLSFIDDVRGAEDGY